MSVPFTDTTLAFADAAGKVSVSLMPRALAIGALLFKPRECNATLAITCGAGNPVMGMNAAAFTKDAFN